MKKILLSILGAFMIFSCGAKQEQKVENQEKLVVHAGLDEEHAAIVTQKFQEKTGIPTEYVRMSNGEILARIKTEQNNMVASVWYGGPVDGIIAADAQGFIEPYVSPVASEIYDEYKSGDGRWTGIYTGYLGFIGNKKLLDAKGLKMPETWEEILKPEFKKEVSVAHPGASGAAYTMLATLVQLMGEKQAMDYSVKLNEQVRQYTKSGTAPARMVGSGEAMLGITFLHAAYKYYEQGYTDLIVSAPKEGTGYEIGAVALLKNAPNSEAAKKFIDFALSKEVQELGQQVGSYQFLTNKNAKNPEIVNPILGTKLIEYNFEWAGQNRKDLVDKFTKITSTEIPKK